MSKPKNFNGQAEQIPVDAYSPPDEMERSKDIVDVVCRIMDDDGPRPMRNCRPAQKGRNAADQFHADHQEVYEARGRQSRDRMQAVRLHNSGYPKLHDELNRKRSTAKVTILNAQRNAAFQQAAYNTCNVCIKNRKRAVPRKKLFSTLNNSKENKKRSKQRQGITRITKSKCKQRGRRSPCRIYRLSKIRTNRGCQCSSFLLAKDKKSGTNDIPLNLEALSKMAAEDNLACRDLKGDKEQSKTSQYSEASSKRKHNPDSDPSVSSYNSYASLEDEPMVAN